MKTTDYIIFKLKCLEEMQQDPEIINQERISAKIELCKEFIAQSKAENLPISDVRISLPDYEYEMFIDDEGTPFEINSWVPIAADRIKDLSRIDEYIAKGLIRKRQ